MLFLEFIFLFEFEFELLSIISMKRVNSISVFLFLLLLNSPVTYLSNAQSDVTTSTLRQQLSVNNQEETFNVGNSLTNNIHKIEQNYQPQQSTQVVFNVGKLKTHENEARKLRKSRPPTLEEMAIKRRIMEIYEAAIRELGGGEAAKASPNLQHLELILRALNPKYIATERLWLATFNNDPVEPPELEATSTTTSISSAPAATSECNSPPPPIKLEPDSPIDKQLDELASRFSSIVSWDQRFAKQLFSKRQRAQLESTPTRKAFTRLLRCLSFPLSCDKPLSQLPAAVKKSRPTPPPPPPPPTPPPQAPQVDIMALLNQHAPPIIKEAWSSGFLKDPIPVAWNENLEPPIQVAAPTIEYKAPAKMIKSPFVNPALTQRLMQIYESPNYISNDMGRPVFRPRPFSDN